MGNFICEKFRIAKITHTALEKNFNPTKIRPCNINPTKMRNSGSQKNPNIFNERIFEAQNFPK